MYREIGIFVVFLLLVSVILIISALYIGRGRLKEKSSFAAGIVAGVLDFYYKPMMGWIQVFSGSPQRLHEIMVHTKNEAAKKKFRLTEKRIIVAPHCMRHRDCPAHVTRTGIQCRSCGRCVYTQILKIAEREHYKVFIVTGSSSVKHVLRSDEAKGTDGILAVGCYYELNKGMRELSGNRRLTVCGYPMLDSGCYNTTIYLIGFENFIKDLRHPDFKERKTSDFREEKEDLTETGDND
ncbi:MAG: DUF116 domain-containing protein [Methanosarcinaceae archaeon]|nr:DUF116 domain-containing protein [Methanosarcinaceae archaeon]